MAAITVMRTDMAMPNLDGARAFLFDALDGLTEEDRKAWRRFWNRVKKLQPGELVNVEAVMPRSGPYHRRHMKIEASVFDAQERFQQFEQFRNWLKIGAGWVDWCAGPKGGVVPIAKSISYAKADQEEFERYHKAVMEFLRGGHAARFLWKHLRDGADAMMDRILAGFEE